MARRQVEERVLLRSSVRKATWGAIALGVWSLGFGSPIREVGWLHRILGIGLLVGYLLLSLDPPEPSKRQRDLFIAGILCGLASFVLAFLPLPVLPTVLARVLAVAVVALPLWLVAGPVRSGFIAAGILAAVTLVEAWTAVPLAVTSLHAYVTAACAFVVAARFKRPTLFTPGEKKPPRVVVASNIVTLTPEQKEKALARLERQYAAGDMPEHIYLDKRQELESR